MKAVLSYLLAFGGLGMMLYALTSVAGRFMYGVAKPMVVHLLRTNPHQAEAMCKADKTTFMSAVAAAIKTAAMMKVRDPNILAQATKPAFDAQCTQIGMHWKSVLKRAKTAAALAVGAIVLGATAGTSVILHVLLAIVTLAGCGWVFYYKLDVDRSLVLARAEVVPEVERAIAEGRYQLPP
ncbi:MAG TPA: hypothetical protein VMJ10_02020 [Kofleriaceae bacterium]|nr:hypothetical protein [Kofleriaceae bacterium]